MAKNYRQDKRTSNGMKKHVSYVLILILLMGLFSLAASVDAAPFCKGSDTDTTPGCKNSDGTPRLIGSCPTGLVPNLDRNNRNANNNCITPQESIDAANLVPLPSRPTTPTSTTTLPGADPTTGYQLLSPIGDVKPYFDTAQPNALGSYLNTMIKIFIGLCAVLAVVMIVVGGMEYMTSELISSKEAGKERIRGALLGLLIALGAYALLFTINPDLLNTDIDIPTATIEVDQEADVPQVPVNGKYGNYATGADWAAIAGPTASLPAWVTVYNSECTTVGQLNCTSTRGLSLGVLGQIHNQCTACGTLIITGGTEFWLHGGKTGSTTHQRNSTTVDLRPNAALNAYLSGGKPLVKMARYPEKGGPYLWEGDHWHIGR